MSGLLRVDPQPVRVMLSTMPLTLPLAGADRRTIWLRVTLLGACFLGLIASAPLWLNTRAFPLVTVAKWFPVLPVPWDKCFLAAMLAALLAAAWFYRLGVKVFLLAVLFAFCEDQNRGQPWLYMYWVMLWLTLLPAPVSLAACRCAISVVYIWSGIQKCNPRFFQVVPAWFVAPAAHWRLPSGAMNLLHWAVASAPFLELGIGLALWAPRLRWTAIGAALVLHLAALLFLGPFGYNYNWVVWPWNLAMMALVCGLFGTGPLWQERVPEARQPVSQRARPGRSKPGGLSNIIPSGAVPGIRLGQTLRELSRSKPALAVLALFAFLPILSYAGWWDSYFSFSLYAENSANANIFVSKAFGERLPPPLRVYVKPFAQTYDPQFQGPCTFAYGTWAYQELHVPAIPEPCSYLAIFAFLRAYSEEPSDLRMIVGPRAGPVIFYQGDERQFLAPK